MIELRGVSKSYETAAGDLPVLSGLDLLVGKGEVVSVVGPSGSGKTTLLNLVGAMEKATSGEVVVNGHDLSGLGGDELAGFRNRELGFIFQQHHLLPQLTVEENVLVPRLAGDWEEDEKVTRERAAELLERVGLGERKDHLPSQLSGGEKQRVAVARALINEPAVVLADEPTGALDEETGAKVADLLFEIQRENEVALVVVTHDLKLAERCGRVLRLEKGRV